MTGQSVPNDQQLAGNVAQQMSEELDDLRATDRSRKQAEVKVPPGYARYRRQGLPIKVVLQHGGLSARGPDTAAVGTLTTPSQLPQDAPTLRGMTGNSTFLPNQMGHTAGGPQAGLVAQRFRTAFESPLDLAQVLRAQPRLAPGTARLLQS